MFVNKLFTYLAFLSQKVKGVLMRNFLYIYFHMKTKIVEDFQICISVPLNASCTDYFTFE